VLNKMPRDYTAVRQRKVCPARVTPVRSQKMYSPDALSVSST